MAVFPFLAWRFNWEVAQGDEMILITRDLSRIGFWTWKCRPGAGLGVDEKDGLVYTNGVAAAYMDHASEILHVVLVSLEPSR